jgi:hypothetical protein
VIETLKDLEKLLKLCRKQGVVELTLGQVSLKLGEPASPQNFNAMVDQEEANDPLENFPDGELTPEELTFFASGGRPEDNPYRQQ